MSVKRAIPRLLKKVSEEGRRERRGKKEGEHRAREGASLGRRTYQDKSSSALDMSHNQNNNAFRGGFAQILGSGPSMENANAYQAIQAKPDTPTRRRAALQTLKPGQGNVSMLQRIKNFVVPPRDLAAIKKVERTHSTGNLPSTPVCKVALRNPRAKPIIARRMQGIFSPIAMPQTPQSTSELLSPATFLPASVEPKFFL
jgi:hypothetical protein